MWVIGGPVSKAYCVQSVGHTFYPASSLELAHTGPNSNTGIV